MIIYQEQNKVLSKLYVPVNNPSFLVKKNKTAGLISSEKIMHLAFHLVCGSRIKLGGLTIQLFVKKAFFLFLFYSYQWLTNEYTLQAIKNEEKLNHFSLD